LQSPEPTTAMPSRPNDKSAPKTQTQGLTLDDYLHAAADIRRTFKLAEPGFALQDVECQAGVSAAVQAIVEEAIDRHGSEIYAKQHELVDTLGREVYGEWTQNPIYSGHRIRPASIKRVLRRTIEVGLQIAVQLPTKEKKTARAPNLGTLATRLERLAGKLEAALQHKEFRARMRIFGEENIGNADSLAQLGSELRRGAETIRAIAKLKVKRVLSDSRNPQIRWAMYFVQWITSSTGSQQYRELTALFEAAFLAAHKRAPAWVDRLAIEMNSKRKRRKAWVRTISK
jgi:hypothetical protein